MTVFKKTFTRAGAGTTVLQTPKANNYCRVVHWRVVAASSDATLVAKFQDSDATDMSQDLLRAETVGSDSRDAGLFDTADGTGLDFVTASATAVSGYIVYEQLRTEV